MAIGKSFFSAVCRFLEERVISEDEEKKATGVSGHEVWLYLSQLFVFWESKKNI